MGIDTREKNMERVREVELCGYPGDKPRHTMWHGFGDCQNFTDSFLFYNIRTRPGQSGSPIIKKEKGKWYIIGIHIGKDREDYYNIGVRLSRKKRTIINDWVGKITGILDLGILRLI